MNQKSLEANGLDGIDLGTKLISVFNVISKFAVVMDRNKEEKRRYKTKEQKHGIHSK